MFFANLVNKASSFFDPPPTPCCQQINSARSFVQAAGRLLQSLSSAVLVMLMYEKILPVEYDLLKMELPDMKISLRSASVHLAFVSSCLLVSAPTLAQTPLKRALAASKSGPVYSYDISYITRKMNAAGRINPTLPAGQQVNVTRPAKSTWTDEFKKAVKEIEKNNYNGFWCSEMAKSIPASARLISQTPATATYTFRPLPDPDEKASAKFVKHLTGRVTVDKNSPAILTYSLSAPKSFKPSILVRINKFDLQTSCARAPDGRTYVKSSKVTVAGSAFGKNFNEKTTRVHGGLRRAAR